MALNVMDRDQLPKQILTKFGGSYTVMKDWAITWQTSEYQKGRPIVKYSNFALYLSTFKSLKSPEKWIDGSQKCGQVHG